jgi:hypothetical protein
VERVFVLIEVCFEVVVASLTTLSRDEDEDWRPWIVAALPHPHCSR